MSHPDRVRAVGVIIPARNEERHIEACLDAVAGALAQLPDGVVGAVCLVVDRSQDATAPTARRWATRGTHPPVDVLLNHVPLPIGTLRNRAAMRVLHRLAAAPPSTIRLVSTDADSRVPPDWALQHLTLAESGADAVSGGVLPDGPIPPGVLVPDGVYAANLGVGADPFLRVGGFPDVHTGEDLRLLRRLRTAGYHVVTSAGIYVLTSIRTDGRARGGLADRLRDHPRTTDSTEPARPLRHASFSVPDLCPAATPHSRRWATGR